MVPQAQAALAHAQPGGGEPSTGATSSSASSSGSVLACVRSAHRCASSDFSEKREPPRGTRKAENPAEAALAPQAEVPSMVKKW